MLGACKGGGGVIIDVCVSDPAAQGFQCVDKKQNPYFLGYDESENFVATNPDDFEKLLRQCKKAKGIHAWQIIEYVRNKNDLNKDGE